MGAEIIQWIRPIRCKDRSEDFFVENPVRVIFVAVNVAVV